MRRSGNGNDGLPKDAALNKTNDDSENRLKNCIVSDTAYVASTAQNGFNGMALPVYIDGAAEKEKISHGDYSFPLGMHKTLIKYNSAVPHETDYTILYTHWHDEFEFFYLKAGHCTFCVGDKEYTLRAGEGFLINPDVIHMAYVRGERETTLYYAAVFSPSFLSAYAGDTVNFKYITPVLNGKYVPGPVFSPDVPWQGEVLSRLCEIISFYDENEYDKNPDQNLHPELFLRKDVRNAELKIKSLLFDIWYICLCNAKYSETGKNSKRINRSNYDRIHRAIEYIHEHYNEKFTLDELASSVYMSKEYFSHIFKEYTNIQPFSYLNSYRIRCSMKLLESTDMKIIEIASVCGFDHVSYYNRKFIELMKCTPTDYRRRYYRFIYNENEKNEQAAN